MHKHDFGSHIYDLVTVGERGQVVIPAKVRKLFNIKPGEKLVAISGKGHPALVLIKTDQFSSMIDSTMKSFGDIRDRLNTVVKK